MSDDFSLIRDRSVRLFIFLRKFVEARSKVIRSLDLYESVLWGNDLPDAPEVYSIAKKSDNPTSDPDLWFEVKKPDLKDPPSPPAEIESWLDPNDLSDSELDHPGLLEQIPGDQVRTAPKSAGASGSSATVLRLADHPQVLRVHEKYVKEKWRPWAERDCQHRAVLEIYTELFSMYQMQQRFRESHEVVVGFGLLTWKPAGTYEVKRHVLTVQAELSFNALKGVISLRLGGDAARLSLQDADDGAKLTLEKDMLESEFWPHPGGEEQILRQIADIEDDEIWTGNKVHEVLQSWCNMLSTMGGYEPTLEPQKKINVKPIINFAPAIILRKRTDHSLIRVFNDIIKDLEQADRPVPPGVERMVTTVDDEGPGNDDSFPSESRRQSSSDAHGEVYFPLSANDEQRQIAQLIERQQGVLVQGPPGTGKSHTIVNLICHLLATGQRVLVTSHTAKALRVLKDKLPQEMKHLCVSLLSDDRQALVELEDSVREFTNRYQTWNASRNQEHIRKLEQALDQVRREEANIAATLRAIRETETYQHPVMFGSYSGTVQAIAARLRAEVEKFSWVLEYEPSQADPPLSDDEAQQLLALLRNTATQEDAAQYPINLSSLLSPQDFSLLVQREAEAQARFLSLATYRSHPDYVVLKKLGREQREKTVDLLRGLISACSRLCNHPDPWVKQAAKDVLLQRHRSWQELLTMTHRHLTAIGQYPTKILSAEVEGLGDRPLSAVKGDAAALHEHFRSGGKIWRWPFQAKVVKQGAYLIEQVRINGVPCRSTDALKELLSWIDVTEHLSRLAAAWAPHWQVSPGLFTFQIAAYQDVQTLLSEICGLQDLIESVTSIIAPSGSLAGPAWSDVEVLHQLVQATEAVKDEESFTEIQREVNEYESSMHRHALIRQAPPAMTALWEAVKARSEAPYTAAYEQLAAIVKMQETLRLREALLARLEGGVRTLASALRKDQANAGWDSRLGHFTAAWNWGRAERWLREITDPKKVYSLREQLDRCRKDATRILCQLAEARAWGYCFAKERFTARTREHLQGWKHAVQRAGRRTGKYAAAHLKAARAHMEHCRSAIPAWIMPVYRVAETIGAKNDIFDVVIVDEASQSGPDALFLFYLAKKVIIVGDDKQISPDYIGVSREEVDYFRRQYLYDNEHRDIFGTESSLFSIADVKYGNRIPLREHFRCMPEIIQFSNQLCYRSQPLIPLRQYGLDRLAPVVTTRYVPDGYLKGEGTSETNPPEADAVVEQIAACCTDPAYDGKTMGVISLLSGSEQAELIKTRLLETIGPEEIERRNLVCGNAYAFQGDERHVIFLSMVSAPSDTRRIPALTAASYERRFNVAASRAQDQMWLFHSVTKNDLSMQCLRYRLLEYAENPQIAPLTIEGLNVEKLKIDVQTVDREQTKPPEPFDSWFEVDMFLRIHGRGYRVIPQFEVADYHIDLVIEGMQGRLAVECDGDFWHGPERYEADMIRERMLQRCGWTFWRVRGGEFYRDPEAAMNDLWRTLDRLGIQPYSSESYSKVAQVALVTQPQDQPQEESEPQPAVAIKEGSRARSVPWAPTRKRQLNLFPSDEPLLAQATVQETETVCADQTITVVPASPLNNGDLTALLEAAKAVLKAGRAGYFKPAERAKVRQAIAALIGEEGTTSFGVRPDKLSDESLARELMRLAGNTDLSS